MECWRCPKQRKCSGADCYYDYHPEPAPELAEDMTRLMNEHISKLDAEEEA